MKKLIVLAIAILSPTFASANTELPHVCAFTFQNELIVGKGRNLTEAGRELQLNCMRDHSEWASICHTFVSDPYLTNCVQVEN